MPEDFSIPHSPERERGSEKVGRAGFSVERNAGSRGERQESRSGSCRLSRSERYILDSIKRVPEMTIFILLE